MQKQDFVRAVAKRAGCSPQDITESMIRRAFAGGALPPASRVAGWIDYREEHIRAMCDFVRHHTRLAFSRRGELVDEGGLVHGTRTHLPAASHRSGELGKLVDDGGVIHGTR